MTKTNLNYKKGAIRISVVLTVIFAIYGYQLPASQSWSWAYGAINGLNITDLAIKEAAMEKCSKASILEVRPEVELAGARLWDHDTLLLILNEDQKDSKLIGKGVGHDCDRILELSHFLRLPKNDKEYLRVSDITKEMFEKAEKIEKERVYWAYTKDRFKNAAEYVFTLWKFLAGIALAFYLCRWIYGGFKISK